MTTRCLHCERELGAQESSFRLALVLQGESMALTSSGGEEAEPEDLLAQLEHLDEDELMAGVHEEISGALCASCRAELRAFLGRRRFTQ